MPRGSRPWELNEIRERIKTASFGLLRSISRVAGLGFGLRGLGLYGLGCGA